MDNAEAIRRIKDHIKVHHIGEYPHIKIAEALNLAISALANDNNAGRKLEVVRCKDCEYCEKYPAGYFCYDPRDKYCEGLEVQADDFCSYGKRNRNDKGD